MDTIGALEDAMDTLSNVTALAVDSEGVDLSRDGPLTVLTLKDISNINNLRPEPSVPALVIDVQTLGGKTVFGARLREILESETIIKYMFDCRSDSDALFYQFNVKLAGVIDCQVGFPFTAQNTGRGDYYNNFPNPG